MQRTGTIVPLEAPGYADLPTIPHPIEIRSEAKVIWRPSRRALPARAEKHRLRRRGDRPPPGQRRAGV